MSTRIGADELMDAVQYVIEEGRQRSERQRVAQSKLTVALGGEPGDVIPPSYRELKTAFERGSQYRKRSVGHPGMGYSTGRFSLSRDWEPDSEFSGHTSMTSEELRALMEASHRVVEVSYLPPERTDDEKLSQYEKYVLPEHLLPAVRVVDEEE
jgi:Ni/Co efflux regulator RcnB